MSHYCTTIIIHFIYHLAVWRSYNIVRPVPCVRFACHSCFGFIWFVRIFAQVLINTQLFVYCLFDWHCEMIHNWLRSMNSEQEATSPLTTPLFLLHFCFFFLFHSFLMFFFSFLRLISIAKNIFRFFPPYFSVLALDAQTLSMFHTFPCYTSTEWKFNFLRLRRWYAASFTFHFFSRVLCLNMASKCWWITCDWITCTRHTIETLLRMRYKFDFIRSNDEDIHGFHFQIVRIIPANHLHRHMYNLTYGNEKHEHMSEKNYYFTFRICQDSVYQPP